MKLQSRTTQAKRRRKLQSRTKTDSKRGETGREKYGGTVTDAKNENPWAQKAGDAGAKRILGRAKGMSLLLNYVRALYRERGKSTSYLVQPCRISAEGSGCKVVRVSPMTKLGPLRRIVLLVTCHAC